MTTSSDPHVLTDDAHATDLEEMELDPEQVVDGRPRTSLASLVTSGDVEIGLWEITHGTVRDTEVDEVFVVLSGEGEVRFADGGVVPLRAGSVVRLWAGEETTWTITRTLRKVYVALPPDPS